MHASPTQGLPAGLAAIFDMAARRLPAAGIECLLIGGFAVNYHGYTRNTLDVDFMIVARQIALVRRAMTKAGFTNVIAQNNAVLFSAPGSSLRVDFLCVDDATLRRLLAGAIRATVYGHPVKLPALKDLLAMKVFSLAHDPIRRMAKDLPDIAALSVLHHLDPETDIHPLCTRFGNETTYRLIRRQMNVLASPSRGDP